jgi:hypothetical protein
MQTNLYYRLHEIDKIWKISSIEMYTIHYKNLVEFVIFV